MKIKGYFDLSGRARVKVRVVCQKPQVNEEVKFLVDTGASRTVLAERDTAKLGINYEDLHKLPRGLLGFGGRVDTYVINNVELFFESDEGVYREHLRQLFAAKHKIKDKQLRERMKQLPSVLGCDILDKFALIRDRREEIVIITDAMAGCLNFLREIPEQIRASTTF
jgi:hypothetical protein